ncbi:hypothetical protein [Microbacterium sp. Clip185]|uniref:hypothetical protein n=1 Tax=Microbacterium sp. Clip185 TaxID=3025663 RepID=UPI002366F075|nr:hypothetical protein [Microbacterium sp. Clip185]WDG19000.1 hypothetical protein PQV94_04465 [Microbacterium sp. Clip185]
MRWERFFEDLQGQFDAEWEAERAVLDTEAERLRLSRVTLRERLLVLAHADETQRPDLGVDLVAADPLTGVLTAVGADWMGLETQRRSVLVPMSAVAAVGVGEGDLLRAARPHPSPRVGVSERMGIGFVLRDLARRRVPVTMQVGTRAVSGTIDRAGADHLDLALHDIDEPRRSASVRGYRLVPFAALSWVRWEGADVL